MPGTLILCATPIGNLADAPPRLGDALGRADVVYAEDTRRSARLLDLFGVSVPLRSYFVGNEAVRARELEDRLRRGDTVVLLTDAGTPGISDPAVSAVRAAVAAGATVTIVPGPSAVTAALALSGFNADRFVFEGFLPRGGEERRRRIAVLAAESRTAVLFSSPRRVAADLADLAAGAGVDRPVVVARELTKLHEEVWRGTLGEAARHWGTEVAGRGEFTIVLAGAVGGGVGLSEALAAVAVELEGGTRLSDAVRRVAAATGVSRRELYAAALHRREESRRGRGPLTPD